MTGNALEWVNDWMGKFRDTTITNYVGAADGGETGERVVKGGSFTHSEKEINPFSRGDVYMVNSATRAEYVGFRLAFGEIPNPRWLSKDGASIDYIITPLANVETIKSLTGSYATKLVFRNDISGNISYLNYLERTTPRLSKVPVMQPLSRAVLLRSRSRSKLPRATTIAKSSRNAWQSSPVAWP